MARSQAADLSGLLTSIGGTLGKMGDAGQPYVEAFKRTMAPDVDMENATSMMQRAQWAQRNGYQDEATRYMALADRQRERQGATEFNGKLNQLRQKAYQTRKSLRLLKMQPNTERQAGMVEAQLEQLYQQMDALGAGQFGGGKAPGSELREQFRQEDRQAAADNRAEKADSRAETASAEESTRFAWQTADRPTQEALLGMRLDSGQLDMIRKAREETEANQIQVGRELADTNIKRGLKELTPEQVQNYDAAVLREARAELQTYWENESQRELATNEGTVGQATLDRAELLAKTDTNIANLLSNYKQASSTNLYSGSSKGQAKALVLAVQALDKQSSEAGRDLKLAGSAAASLQVLVDEGSRSSVWDGANSFTEVLKGEDEFVEMQRALSTMMAEQGITEIPFEQLELMMSEAAKGLSKKWREADQRYEARRKAGERRWRKEVDAGREAYITKAVDAYPGGAWTPEEVEQVAEDTYDEAINFINTLVMPGKTVDEQLIMVARESVKPGGVFLPRKVGTTGYNISPIFSMEVYEQMIDHLQKGERFNRSNFEGFAPK